MLVLESSRVEVAVLLNELAYSKYEASKSSSSTDETIISRQQKVTIVFSLVEKIIKLISNIGETEGILLLLPFKNFVQFVALEFLVF